MKNIINLIFNGKKQRLEINITSDPKVDDLVHIFNQIISTFKPSACTSEEIFDILFLENKNLFQKLILIAKLLIPKGIELCLKILDAAQMVICEIISYSNACHQKLVRVLHYLSDGALGLTELIPV